MATITTQLSDKQTCSKCGAAGEFGYKIKGGMQWLCEKQALSK